MGRVADVGWRMADLAIMGSWVAAWQWLGVGLVNQQRLLKLGTHVVLLTSPLQRRARAGMGSPPRSPSLTQQLAATQQSLTATASLAQQQQQAAGDRYKQLATRALTKHEQGLMEAAKTRHKGGIGAPQVGVTGSGSNSGAERVLRLPAYRSPTVHNAWTLLLLHGACAVVTGTRTS